MTTGNNTAANRRLAKKRVQCLNEALCFVSSSVLADSSVLRNTLLRQAPKRYLQLHQKLRIFQMRIITWNCNMAFRKKSEFITSKNPDILVIQECENPDKNLFENSLQKPYKSFWYGTNNNKGIGIFTFSNYEIELLNIHNPEFRFILPLSAKNNENEYTILAVWTQKPKNHDCYTEQIWNAIHHYSELLQSENLIIIGDFNSNSIWDKPKRIYNHTNLINKLLENKIYSSYHIFYNEIQGKESKPTLFMHRKKEKPYHIDYCFVSERLKDNLLNVEVGEYEFWTKLSDHKPIIIDFKN